MDKQANSQKNEFGPTIQSIMQRAKEREGEKALAQEYTTKLCVK